MPNHYIAVCTGRTLRYLIIASLMKVSYNSIKSGVVKGFTQEKDSMTYRDQRQKRGISNSKCSWFEHGIKTDAVIRGCERCIFILANLSSVDWFIIGGEARVDKPLRTYNKVT